MRYEQKTVHFALAQISRKMGVRNHIQRHTCNHCNKTFTCQKKLNPANIWFDYSQGKQTYKELAEKYLFIFEKHAELNIERATNRLEGLFSELKQKLYNHNGLRANVKLFEKNKPML